MKKLMIALAVVAIAAVSQAAQVKWQGTMYGVDPTAVGDNGAYAASGALANTDTWSATIRILSADGSSEVYKQTASGKMGSAISVLLNNSAIHASTDYTYEIVVTASQASLKSKASDTYDYSAATLETTITGGFKTNPSGLSPLNADSSSWKVSGIVAAPEPTSGLLLLLGVGALALRRRRA